MMSMEFNERFEAARTQAGLNQSEVARALKIKPQSVRAWEVGDTEPRRKRIADIAELLNVSEVWLATGHGEMASGISDAIGRYGATQYVTDLSSSNAALYVDHNNYKVLPVLTNEETAEFISAGAKNYSFSKTKNRHLFRDLPATSTATFGIEISGGSMEPKFHDGDLLAIDTTTPPVNGSYVVAVRLSDSAIMFKQLVIESDGSRFLRSTTPGWPNSITVIDDGIVIGGMAVFRQPLGGAV